MKRKRADEKWIQPITKLTEATKEITRENFHYPLTIDRNDEIGQLVESINTMQTQLQHNDEARKSFINNVSHDFQSPLMNIQGYTELLLSQNVNERDAKEYLQVIDHESKRLSNLTKQLLLLTSLDQKAYPMKISEVQLDEQIK
ncbi:sensor histidine kinase [Fredinandcohnia onubensis]|uniref:sensor histidine kinase n=1 Tax=Fredinandcohnia onubensis TaxID=1571209 RepID=UPI00211DFDBE|nr:HAMP domain-containing sensor histidine kinase [Fredinandcohnia onubensis]